MTKVFLDSSVLFSAIFSKKGYARNLFELAENGSIELIISDYVLEEVKRNLKNKAVGLLDLLETFIDVIPIKVVKSPSKNLVIKAVKYTHVKDAAVVASALEQKVDYLVSYDRKDLTENKKVKQKSGLKIVFPKEIVVLLH